MHQTLPEALCVWHKVPLECRQYQNSADRLVARTAIRGDDYVTGKGAVQSDQ